jgi:hypothetical protein
VLANEVTALCHGREAAEAAEATAREVFEKGGAGDDLPTLAQRGEVGDGISIVQLITRSGLAKSGKEAKRLIADGGARMNDSAPGKSVTHWSSSRPDPLHLSKNTAGERRWRGGGAPKTARPQPRVRPPAARCPIHRKIAIITPVAPAIIVVCMHDARPRDTLPHTRHGRRQNQRPGDAQQQVDPHAKRPDLDPVGRRQHPRRASRRLQPHIRRWRRG